MRFALALTLIAGCECAPPPLVVLDAGEGEVDAGEPSPSDAGGDVDAGDSDAGEPDGGTPCVFQPTEPLPYEPDGSEDFLGPLTDLAPPDADLLATWSRFEGDDFVIEMRFSAPPFRAERLMGVRVGLFVDAEPGFQICQRLVPEAQNCTFPDSLFAVENFDGPTRVWPPDTMCIKERERVLCEPEDVCSHVFVTEGAPFLRLRVPASAIRATPDSTYVVEVSYSPRIDGDGGLGDVSWDNPADTIAIGGGGAPVNEPFVSVCDVPCPSNDG